MSRPYKVINGVSYPNLYNGPKKKVTANLSDPHEFYHDDGIRLADENLEDFVGKPICVEHDVTASVGEITAAWRDTDGKMRITGRIYVDSEDGRQLYDRVNRGDMKGLSVGYGVSMGSDGSVVKKNCQEISLCREPFFEGAQVAVCATGNEKYKTNEKGKIVFRIMASETNSAAATAAVPLDSVNKDASELARAHDELLKKSERDAAELKQLREEREQQLARYAESRKPQLKEVLDLTDQQYKEEKGPDAKISDNYRESIERVFLNPAGEHEAAVITASAMTWKKARDQKIAMEARMKELEAKNNQMIAEQTHVKASLERINSITAADSVKSVDVAASSAAPLTASNIFQVRASERERNLYRENYGRDLPVSVTASSAQASAPTIPTHSHVGLLQHSLRNSAPHMFAFACDRDKFANAPTRGITKSLTRLDD